MPERKCIKCGGEMEHVSEVEGEPIRVTPPNSERAVPADLWICNHCKNEFFYVHTRT